MNKQELIQFLLSGGDQDNNVSDPYYNNLELFLRLDLDVNPKGYPYFRDYSPKQRQVKYERGTSADSEIVFVKEGDDNFLAQPNVSGLNITSYLYFPNKFNQNQLLGALNTNSAYGSIKGSQLEIFLNGTNPVSLGTSDFTVEISFFLDDVNLPWKFQTLFSYDQPLMTNGDNTVLYFTGQLLDTNRCGLGLFVYEDDLYFYGKNTSFDAGIFKLNSDPLIKNTWYHVVLQRKNGTLESYINFVRVNTVNNFNVNLDFTISTNESTLFKRLSIGATSTPYTRNIVSNAAFYAPSKQILTTFSGGMCNFRITKGVARIDQSFYSPKLPFPINPVNNKIDSYYSDVLLYLPATHDLFDYSSYKSHFTNRDLINNKYIDINYGGFYLDSKNTYESPNLSANISETEWTLEFYLSYFLNKLPHYSVPGGLSNLPLGDIAEKTMWEVMSAYNAVGNYPPANNGLGLDSTLPFIEFTSNNKKVMRFYFRFLIEYFPYPFFYFANAGCYLGFQASENGDDWLDFTEESEGVKWIPDLLSFLGTSIILPTDELRLLNMHRYADNVSHIRSFYQEPGTHVAIQRYNNNLYVFVNGQLKTTTPITFTLNQTINNLKYSIKSSDFQELNLSSGSTTYTFSLGVKNLRFTNKARYNTSITNNYFNSFSFYPLPLNTGELISPRARVRAITKTVTLSSISTEQASWNVFVTQALENLVLDDFSLIQTDGVVDAELVSITKQTEFLYVVVSSTGTGNGNLGLNFVDRYTVKYKDTNTKISYYTGELSLEGEVYSINKDAPVPILSSGSNPYINSSFQLTLSFDSAIESVDYTKIGAVNGTIDKFEILDEENHIYRVTVTPILQDPVIVQAMEGTGVTDGNINSEKSSSLTRIYSKYFPIIQLPLNIINGFNDLSPSKLVFEEVVSNSLVYSSDIHPFGETSSLYVKPTLEQGGLRYENYNAVASTNTIAIESDWTIEFYLRIDSNNKNAHIFSIENGGSGICFVANNKNLKIQRTVENTASMFSTLTWADIDTGTFKAWDDDNYTVQQKFPHFAVSKQGNVYRFYRNGVRIQLIQSDITFDVTKGTVNIGYYANRVNETEYYLSNVKVTLGKALYTSAVIEVPGLPFDVLPNITEVTELLSYISIYSDNRNNNKAASGNKITLKFISILNLTTTPTVTIAGREAALLEEEFNVYKATILVDSDDLEGLVNFEIKIEDEPSIPDKTFTQTTNNTFVAIDKTALTASITTEDPNDNRHQILAYITFSEDTLESFSLDLITTSNCFLSNLFKYPNQNKYSFYITAVEDGTISIQLPVNKIKDLAGNFNSASNSLSRNCVIPAYVADPYWDNVIFLLQPDLNIYDESTNAVDLTVNNVVISSNTSPTGLSKSLFFNGINSSITFDLGNTLPANLDYTLELFMYCPVSTVLRLSKPNSLPGNEVTSKSFKANWETVEEADFYSLSVSNQASFVSHVEGFKDRNVGNVDSYTVSTDKLNSKPYLLSNAHRSDKGMVLGWKYNSKRKGFKFDLGLNNSFSNRLYQYKDKFTSINSTKIGKLNRIESLVLESNDEVNPNKVPLSSGTVITGILTNNSYPKLEYFLEESSLRLYGKEGYVMPAIAEDIITSEWKHVAVVNKGRYTYLYVSGELVDKVKNIAWSNSVVDIGYSLSYFYGYLTGIRITKGVARYSGSGLIIPTLPYSKN